MSHTAKMTLTIDIDVVLDDGETDLTWVTDEFGHAKRELILGGYWFQITRIEEVGSSAAETENPHPDVDEEYHPGSGEDDYDEAAQQERER
jgi:hypothetical protein